MKQCPVAKRGVQKHQFVLATAVAMFFCQPSHAPLVEAAQGYPWLQRWPGRRHAGSLVNFCSGVHRWLQYVTLVGMARSSTHDMNMCVCVCAFSFWCGSSSLCLCINLLIFCCCSYCKKPLKSCVFAFFQCFPLWWTKRG